MELQFNIPDAHRCQVVRCAPLVPNEAEYYEIKCPLCGYQAVITFVPSVSLKVTNPGDCGTHTVHTWSISEAAAGAGYDNEALKN